MITLKVKCQDFKYRDSNLFITIENREEIKVMPIGIFGGLSWPRPMIICRVMDLLQSHLDKINNSKTKAVLEE